jgi:hypothetical protein
MKYSLARPVVAALAIASALSVSSPMSLAAQGTTTAAISGVVTSQQGQGIEGAAIQVTNTSTGFSLNVTTNVAGRYFVPGLEISTAYRVTAKRIGFRPMVKNDVSVNLGDVRKIDFIMEQQAATLSEITVTAALDPVIDPSHQGTETTVSDSALRRLPTLNRNFTDFVALTPQVSTTLFNGGLSGGGTNNRYNNVQIDGTAEADVFGLGSTGQPGGQANGKSIGLEAVKEYKVMLSPFDVRQGFFAGLLINAVTKSGTNDYIGTAFAVNRNANNTRKQTFINDAEQNQYGFSFGGPIIKDRAFFFISPEFQTQNTPATGQYYNGVPVTLSDTALGVRIDSLLSAVSLYTGLDGTGTFGLINNENPLQNLFARVDVNLPFNTQFVARMNYGHAEQDVFSRSTSSFKLSNNAYYFNSKKIAPAIQLRTLLPNGSYNEFMAGYTQIRDRRTPRVLSPEYTINAAAGLPVLVGGSERFSHGNELDQDLLEVTENFTMPMGDHRVTLGTQNEFQRFRNLFAQSTFGVWRFSSPDSMKNGLPDQYIIGVPLEPNGTGGVQNGGDGAVKFSSALFSYYLQDEWTASPKLNISIGIRADVPVFNDRPPENPGFLTTYGRSTAQITSGQAQWSPRAGFNLDVTGDGRNQLRGGLGLFTGRPAYVWLANAFQNSGMGGVALLSCTTPATVQPFNNANIATPPTQCANGTTAALGGEINLMDPSLKYPQNMRATLAFDRRLTRTWTSTAEVLYTKGVNGLFYQNLALSGVQGINAKEGRVVYGAAAGAPVYKPGGRTSIFEVSNQSNDYAYSLTAGLTRRYLDNYMASLFYTQTRAFDVQSFTSSTAFSQLRFGRVTGGDLADQTATRSTFEQRHRVVGQVTYTLPSKTDVSLIYYGESGSPFTYIASGDLNADGLTLNDPIYVPKNAMDNTEIRFNTLTVGSTVFTPQQQAQAFENYIRGEKCLNDNRGKLLPRNSCTDPWVNTVNLSARQSLKTYKLQNVTLEVNVFNFLNLLNKGWGLRRTVGTSPITLMNATAYTGGTAVTGYPLYTFNPGFVKYFTNNLASNYQIQTQLRYAF